MSKYRHIFDFRHYAPFTDEPGFLALSPDEQVLAARAHARLAIADSMPNLVLISVPSHTEYELKLPPNAKTVMVTEARGDLESGILRRHLMDAQRDHHICVGVSERTKTAGIRGGWNNAFVVMADAMLTVDDAGVQACCAKYRHGDASSWMFTIHSIQGGQNGEQPKNR